MMIHDRRITELSAREFHEIARLRVEVFVVEQSCPYPELDGCDIADTTRHVYTSDDLGVVSYLRVLEQDDAHRIGRVLTRADARSAGLAGALLDHVLTGDAGPWVLDAQAHLAGWYARRGFIRAGGDYLDYGILHVPMRRKVTRTVGHNGR